jgi:tripartite-type tricarboxylate transporter receptor subunit TctC
MSMALRHSLIGIAILFGLTLVAPFGLAATDSYPNHPIRLIVPFAAGGITDVQGRIWARAVTPALGTVAVENRAGGGSMIGAAEVAHAAPDGYTLLIGNTSNQVLNPELMRSPPFNAEKDLTPVAIFATIPNVIVVSASLPVHNLRELAAYARAHPGKLSYGSAGVGTMTNLSGELFKKLAGGLNIVQIPYRGGAPATADLISGTLPMASLSMAAPLLALHKQGKIRILCVDASSRLKIAPDIPVAAESGFPGLMVEVFDGVFVPTRTPKSIIDRISTASKKAMSDPEVQRAMERVGARVVTDSDPEKARRLVMMERNRWRPIIRESGIPMR